MENSDTFEQALRLQLCHLDAWESAPEQHRAFLAPTVLRAMRRIATDALNKGNSQGKAQP